MSKNTVIPKVGETLSFEHFQIHPYDVKYMAGIGNRITARFKAAHSLELTTTGMEAEIMDWFLVSPF